MHCVEIAINFTLRLKYFVIRGCKNLYPWYNALEVESAMNQRIPQLALGVATASLVLATIQLLRLAPDHVVLKALAVGQLINFLAILLLAWGGRRDTPDWR